MPAAAPGRIFAHRWEGADPHCIAPSSFASYTSYGYAVTAHSAQGVTAETTHAVLGETATRALAYVAMTHGRHANSAYMYERTTEHEYPHESAEACHVMARGGGQRAARLLRGIVAHDEQPLTALGIAAANAHHSLPSRVRSDLDQRAALLRRRGNDYERWRAASAAVSSAGREAASRTIGADLSSDYGLEI